MDENRHIRLARVDDVERIMEVLAVAKQKMRDTGNMNQWIDGYPTVEAILFDIERDGGFVFEENGVVVAYFAMLPSPEPTYAKIFGGEWLNDEPYHVVHRMGSLTTVHGIFAYVMDFCFKVDRNVRVDTHRDNKVMQHLIEKCGFTYCGIIYLANGDERLAYHKAL